MTIELTREGINEQLRTNDRAVARALIVINNNQTFDEQACEQTTHHNGTGFTSFDAKMGTSMANFYVKYCYLSPRQLAYWRKLDKNGNIRIGKYWRQLVDAANAKKKVAV
jgi:hypothetical protein